MLSVNVTSIKKDDKQFTIEANGASYSAKAVLLATGFDLFPAQKKEEYG